MLSIVIPQYNKAIMTENCIDSVIKHTDIEHEIVIVDNGSTEEISEQYKNKVKFVKLTKNLLFAKGCNNGVFNTKFNNLCILNNDTLMFENWYNSIDILNSRPDVGIVGSKLLYPDKTLQHAGMNYLPNRIEFEHKFKNQIESFPPANVETECPAVTGACIFVRKSEFLGLGGFDEKYKNWYEDIDLCFKYRYLLKKKVIYNPNSKLTHLESATGKEMNLTAGHVESRAYFYKKWENVLQQDYYNWRNHD